MFSFLNDAFIACTLSPRTGKAQVNIVYNLFDLRCYHVPTGSSITYVPKISQFFTVMLFLVSIVTDA